MVCIEYKRYDQTQWLTKYSKVIAWLKWNFLRTFCFYFREFIEDVLNLVNCKVLQYAQSATTDTYVLSESSMFIFRTHFVLKTCGETTLLHAVQPILDLAHRYCGFDVVDVRKKTEKQLW